MSKIENFEYVVFLDIDGVLNHMYMKTTFDFLKESVDVLNYMYDKYNIQIVLSTSWRHAFTFNFMQQLFKDNNIKAPIIDRTYIVLSESSNDISFKLDEIYDINPLDNVFSREAEIYKWVTMFNPEHFIIIDDYKMNNDFLYKYQLLTNFYGEENDCALRFKHIDIIDDIFERRIYE